MCELLRSLLAPSASANNRAGTLLSPRVKSLAGACGRRKCSSHRAAKIRAAARRFAPLRSRMCSAKNHLLTTKSIYNPRQFTAIYIDISNDAQLVIYRTMRSHDCVTVYSVYLYILTNISHSGIYAILSYMRCIFGCIAQIIDKIQSINTNIGINLINIVY